MNSKTLTNIFKTVVNGEDFPRGGDVGERTHPTANNTFGKRGVGSGGSNFTSADTREATIPYDTRKREEVDKMVQNYNYAGYESSLTLHNSMPGTMTVTKYQIEIICMTCHLPSLPKKDTQFFHFRFGMDLIYEGNGSRQNLLTWDVNEYMWEGRKIYQCMFKSGQVRELVYETSQNSLLIEMYIIDLRTRERFPLNSYDTTKYPITLSLRLYNTPIRT